MKRVWIIAFFLLVAACGGGGGVGEAVYHFDGPTEMAVDPDPLREDGALLYVLNAAGGSLSIMNAQTHGILKSHSPDPYSDEVLWLGKAPLDIDIVPTGEQVYVTDTWRDNVRTVGTSDPWPVAEIDLALEAAHVSIAPVSLEPETLRPIVPAAWNERHEVWFSDPDESRLVVWDHAAGQVVGDVALPSAPTDLLVSRDGEQVFVIGEDATLRVVDAAARRLLESEVPLGGRPGRIVESRDGAWVFVLDIDPPQLHLIDTTTWTETDDEIMFPMALNGMAMSTDGTLGFISSDDGYVYYYFVDYRRACGSQADHAYFFDQGPRGNPTIERIETTDCLTVEETWTIAYHLDLLAWEVRGSHSGWQVNLAYTNQAYVSDEGEIQFFIREGDYRESDGDFFQFQTEVGVAPIPVGAVPTGVAVTPDQDDPEFDLVFVANTTGQTISRIFTGEDANLGAVQ